MLEIAPGMETRHWRILVEALRTWVAAGGDCSKIALFWVSQMFQARRENSLTSTSVRVVKSWERRSAKEEDCMLLRR